VYSTAKPAEAPPAPGPEDDAPSPTSPTSPARAEAPPAPGSEGGDGQEPPPIGFETPEGYTMTTSEPLVQAAMRALGEAWPRALDFHTLLERALKAAGDEAPEELVRARLRVVLLQAYLARIVMLQGCPPPVANRAGEHPTASPLARAQSAAGMETVSSLLHANVRLEGELEPRLLPLLDGTRSRSELSRALDAPEEQVSESLLRLASVGLLAG
jgi:hypothetical protein